MIYKPVFCFRSCSCLLFLLPLLLFKTQFNLYVSLTLRNSFGHIREDQNKIKDDCHLVRERKQYEP